MNDEEIIDKIQNGDLKLFGEIFEKYSKKIYNFLYFRTHHKETSEDLTSIVFTKAFGKIDQFEGKKSKFSTWLYQIAKNSLIDHFRTLKISENIEDVWDLPSSSDVEKDTDTSLLLEKAKEYIKKLPSQQRDIVIMRLWDDLSHREIAEILEISEGNSKVSFKRALEKLKVEMGQNIFISLLVFKSLKDIF